jgi:putative endonuclease
MREYHVYILASRSRTLYVGVTNNLTLRIAQHRNGECTFTSRYNVHRLVFVESTSDVHAAIAREKQIKGYSRKKKLALVNAMNPAWEELMPEVQIPRCAGDDRRADPSLRSG